MVDGTDVTPDANVTNSSVDYLPVEPLGCGDHDFTIEVKSDRYTVGYGRGGFQNRLYHQSTTTALRIR